MRESLTAHDIANEIRMARGASFSGAFLIVEGGTDSRLYKQFVDQDLCKIIPSYGKENAIDVLGILGRENFDGLLAVVDADFWRLDGIEPTSPNLLITDTHDLETMILKSPALEKLLIEFGSDTKIKELVQRIGKSVRNILLDGGIQIGYLRWVSHKEKLSLKFEDITFGNFIDNETLTIDISAMVTTVQNKSRRYDPNKEDLQKSMDGLANPSHDPWDVCSGHDLVCILSFGLRKVLGTNNANAVKPELIEKSLRLAYEAAYFFATQLYKSLRAWEKANQPFKVFSES